MGNKIVLIEPIGGMNFTPDPAKRGNQAPPYAIEVLAGYLKEKGGYETHLIHQRPISQKYIKPELQGKEAGELSVNITDEDIVEMIGKLGGNEVSMVGLSAITPLFNRSLQIAQKIKEKYPEIKIVIGGYHSSAIKEKVYLSGKYNKWEQQLRDKVRDPSMKLVDYFVVGEGDKTLHELADALKKGETDFSEIKGVIYRDEQGKVNEFKYRERMTDKELAELPEAYRKILAPYKNEQGKTVDIREIPSSADCTQFGTFPGDKEIHGEIQMTGLCRGCPGDCTFCSSPIIWGEQSVDNHGNIRYKTPVKFRDPKKVISEIQKYHENPEYKTNYVYFADLTFNENISRLKALCEEMIKSGIFGTEDKEKVHWFCLSKAFLYNKKSFENGAVREVLELMKKAGCSKIGIGIEGATLEDIAELKRPSGKKDKEELIKEGLEKFTNVVLSLKQASETGMFTRGYFVWGRQKHNEYTNERAKALLELSIPSELFKDYDKLKEAVAFVFQKQSELAGEGDEKRPFNSAEISELVAEKFGMQNSSRERFLEIDHLRLSPETPYPETELSRMSKLRYYDIERDENGLFARNEKGELIKKLDQRGEPIVIEDERTLEEAINEGWDDWEILSQEYYTLWAGREMDEIKEGEDMIVKDFYSSEAYRESSLKKIKRFPFLQEAYKSWSEFLNNALKKYEKLGIKEVNFEERSETREGTRKEIEAGIRMR